ncbi:insulin-like growth factor-binding protein 2-A isoform X2 [Electrophorus electricus]|uniref:insulin-like growth factor-binding protein 2-A isoform X2 n=1 Tax=Electrophorus electricus TaxID=8005 RepID=UPI0015CFA487|nr:insulin-like growth factor-binding protein 2-A isoform X2 [Electrophorus electricus]
MARMILYASCGLLVALLAFPGASRAEMVFRCPSCTAERQDACAALTESCAEIVREPGCGCCPVCARKEGELCGVYTPRCSSGLRCYPKPDSDLPLEQLVQGLGRCGRKVDAELAGSVEVSGEVLELSETGQTELPPVRKPTKASQWMGPKESAVIHHRHQMKTKMKYKSEEGKVPRAKLSQCQQELDQVLERISKMPFRDNRGPLEDLYSLHIPNCDKKGQYNLKQCKMSVNGYRGECWCVDPHSGRPIPTSPRVRGDPNCSQYFDDLDTEPVPLN